MNKIELRTYFQGILNNTESTDTLADSFLDVALRRMQRRLRLEGMETTYTYTVPETGYVGIPIPTDYLDKKYLWLVDGDDSRQLEMLPMSKWIVQPDDGGTPCFYIRQGTYFQVKPTPLAGKTFKLLYYKQQAPLMSDGDYNALTTEAPEVVAYGALVLAADYFADVRGGGFKAAYTEMMMDLQAKADLEEVSGSDQSQAPAYADY